MSISAWDDGHYRRIGYAQSPDAKTLAPATSVKRRDPLRFIRQVPQTWACA